MRLWPRAGETDTGEDERWLASRENLVSSSRLHPTFLWRVALETTVAVLIIGTVELVTDGDGDLADIGWVALLLAFLRLAVIVYDWHDIRVMITDRRIIRVHGLIVKKVNTMPLAKVTDLTYRRTGPGKLFGYGTFVVESAGQEHGLRELRFVPTPDALYADLCEMMFGAGPPPRP